MPAPRRVLTCTLGAAWESALLRIAEHPAAALRVEARCGEPGEALGVAMRDRPDVVVAEDVPGWWDRDAVARFTELGIAVVVVGDAPPGARPCDASPEAIVAAVHDLGGALAAPPPDEEPTPTGRVTAVWGGHGAPGRTTLAIHLASVYARATDALLIDADVWSPSVALRLGNRLAPLHLEGLHLRREEHGEHGLRPGESKLAAQVLSVLRPPQRLQPRVAQPRQRLAADRKTNVLHRFGGQRVSHDAPDIVGFENFRRCKA